MRSPPWTAETGAWVEVVGCGDPWVEERVCPQSPSRVTTGAVREQHVPLHEQPGAGHRRCVVQRRRGISVRVRRWYQRQERSEPGARRHQYVCRHCYLALKVAVSLRT